MHEHGLLVHWLLGISRVPIGVAYRARHEAQTAVAGECTQIDRRSTQSRPHPVAVDGMGWQSIVDPGATVCVLDGSI